MNFRILTFCLLTSIYAFGQATVLKEKKGESYYVLKDNPKIKHGLYQLSIKKVLVEKGQYENDRKIGVWEFYDLEGNLEQKYDYSLKQLIFNKEAKQFGGYKIIAEGKPTDVEPDTPPIFIGGRSRYERFIGDNLKYPGGGIEGKEFVQVSLSRQGEILGTSIYKPILSADIDKEALRLAKELPKEWIAAKHQGSDVESTVILPMAFRPK